MQEMSWKNRKQKTNKQNKTTVITKTERKKRKKENIFVLHFGYTSRKHAYIILTPLNLTFI